ncbi:MAG: acetyl-CoA C-acyltransferase FadI [Rhodothermia bacterium]|nr:acetyl-CoA C-acyltransferase FadI [Rhodothermia bacterium]
MDLFDRDRGRVAVVAGLRTPFARQATELANLNAVQLGSVVTRELLARTPIDPSLIERVVYGSVGILPEAPNIAREVSLAAGLPPETDAYSISRACTTSFQTLISVAQAIWLGDIEIGLAGGSDSTSVLPVQVSRKMAKTLIRASRAKSLSKRIQLYGDLRPSDLVPVAPAVKDYTTEMTMGEIAEQMARNHQVTREEQDKFALRSHKLAAKAWAEGRLESEVMTVIPPPYEEPFSHDNNIRPDTSLEKMAQLKPAFDKRHGTVTAANATPLTDGASSMILMSEQRARDLDLEPLGYIRSHAFVAIDPFNDALMGPSFATPKALRRAGLKLTDVDLIDMHEAFAAQTLANIKNWPSREFARDYLGLDEPIGEIDPDRFNVLGGSIAYGHPFAATGGRIVVQLLNEMRRRGASLGLATACAAGGIGAAVVLET